MKIHENLSSLDRSMRILVAITLGILSFLLPIDSMWIAAISLAAMYPLLSGITAIDPLFSLAENIAPETIHLDQ